MDHLRWHTPHTIVHVAKTLKEEMIMGDDVM